MVLDIATRTVEVMREQGASDIVAWVGPHVCGSCYEVPEQMRAEVVRGRAGGLRRDLVGHAGARHRCGRARPADPRAASRSSTSPAAPARSAGLHSYRRDGAAAGRFAGLVWLS